MLTQGVALIHIGEDLIDYKRSLVMWDSSIGLGTFITYHYCVPTSLDADF